MCGSGIPTQEHWLVSLQDCEARCGQLQDCFGFEFSHLRSNTRGYKRCQLQMAEVTHPIPAPGSTCMIKISPGTLPSMSMFPGSGSPGQQGTSPLGGPIANPSGIQPTGPAAGTNSLGVPAANPLGMQPTGATGGLATAAPPPRKKIAECQGKKLTRNCGCCMFLRPGADLSTAAAGQSACTDLAYADLSGVNIAGATLEDAVLTCSNLDNANVEGVNCINCIGLGSSWRGARAEGLNLQESSMKSVDFTGAHLLNMNAELTEFERSTFTGANLGGSKFVEANLNYVDFTNAKGMHTADFMGATNIQTAKGIGAMSGGIGSAWSNPTMFNLGR
eukprot:CAMPEP_0119343392 /NCGR_PEP_ID=MMETSP1333-20130426/106423_1 /TAXON_ID=418940 /ORGANISM="Scyphosphaera apsteinii, Strain RCC1455" /LENGTH=332 /DNA_ID=CAMNT_0007355781 /DNA_START=111 /DNA_END=1109 /DNA_ORIENTATION=+